MPETTSTSSKFADAPSWSNDVMPLTKALIYHLIFIGFLLLCWPAHAQQPQWRDLVTGGNLAGWRTLGGSAPYAVESGEVVGRSVLNSPNSWLATKETFGDFILEYEAKVDPKLNSG